jgi:hypothetical protein
MRIIIVGCIVILVGCSWTSISVRPNGWDGQINCTGDFSNFGEIDLESQGRGWESFELAIFFWRDRPHPVADKIRLTVDGESVLVQAFKEGRVTKEGYFPLTDGQLITRYHGKELEGGEYDDEISFTCNERGLIIRRWSNGWVPFMFGTQLSGTQQVWYFFPALN